MIKRPMFITLLVCLIVCIVACGYTLSEKENDNVSQKENSSASTLRTRVTDENAESILRSSIRKSSMVIEGTVTKKEVFQPRESPYFNYNNDYVWDVYTFDEINVVTGFYEQDTLILSVSHDLYYTPDNSYEIGQRYLVVVLSSDAVTSTSEIQRYQNFEIVCKLSSKVPDTIEKITIGDYQVKTIDKQELIEIINEEVGIQHEYYNERDQYVHSDIISDIVDGADIVAKIRVDDVNNKNTDMAIEYCFCTLLKLYKGEILEMDGNQFQILPNIYSTKAGEEYIVLLKPIFSPSRYYQAAKKNAIIPITDTDRVQQVYDALGIHPET